MIDRDQFVNIIKEAQGELTNAEFAAQVGVSPQFICDVYRGRRDPGPALAKHFGYKPVRAYKLDGKRNGVKA